MIDRRTLWLGGLLAALALCPALTCADDPQTTKVAKTATDLPVDNDLLEYLGSVDSEGQDWMEYLSHTDITQVVNEQKGEAAPEGKKQ